MNNPDHETTISEDEEQYTLDCNCDNTESRGFQSYKNAFSAGYQHWKEVNSKS